MKDLRYKAKKNHSFVTRHDYPPDQFMTKQTMAPSDPKQVPTNLYASSEHLLNDFFVASKFAADIRRNKELPESQRKSVAELMPPSTHWSTRGEQAPPPGATMTVPNGASSTATVPNYASGLPLELQAIYNANSTSRAASAAASQSEIAPQPPIGSHPQETVTTLACLPATYLPFFPQSYNSEASPFRADALPAGQYGGEPMPQGIPQSLGPPASGEVTYSSPPELQGYGQQYQSPSLVTHFEICTPPDPQGNHRRGPHRCYHCKAKFLKDEAICRLYDQQCFHQGCLE